MSRSRDLASRIVKTATGGVLTLRSSDTTITDGSVLGKLEFNAPDEGSGTDALLVGAAIHAVAEGTFTASSNASELVFMTGSSEAASSKMVLSSGGNLSVAGTLTPTGVLTANAGVVVDNITIDGTEIDLSSGDLTLDVAGDIVLDAGGSDISLQSGGAEYGKFNLSSNNLNIHSSIQNANIVFKGNDGGSTITALTFDMSEGGNAIFNQHAYFVDNGYVVLGAGEDVKIHSDGTNGTIATQNGHLNLDSAGQIFLDGADDGTVQLRDTGTQYGQMYSTSSDWYFKSVVSDKDIIFQGVDGGSQISALTLDMSAAGAATFNSSITAERLYSDAGIVHTGDTDTSIDFLDNAMLIYTGAYRAVDISAGGIIFNEASADADFRVESNGSAYALFVDGGNNHVNIMTSTDLGAVLNVSGNAYIQHADNSDTLTLECTDADANAGPHLRLFRNSANPADNDQLGQINFDGEDDSGGQTTYARIVTQIKDTTNGTEDGRFAINTIVAGSLQSRLDIQPTEIVFNNESIDVDFRVESNGNANMLFVDGGNDRVGINNGSPARQLHITDTIANGGASLGLTSSDSTTTGSLGIIHFGNNTDSSLASIGGLADGATDAGALLFKTEATGGAIEERFRISSDGSLSTPTLGTSNVRFGVNAGNSIASGGNYNVVVGDEAGTAITTGDGNAALGYAALSSNTTASYNTAIGRNALAVNTTGDHNVAVGNGAMSTNVDGDRNVAVGYNTLATQDPASNVDMYNTAVGYSAGAAVTTGIFNTLIGGLGGDALTEGGHNVAIGAQALSADTKGSKNTAVGHSALEAQNFTTATSSYNTAIGSDAAKAITTGISNTIIGSSAGDALTDADYNVALGYHALSSDTLGSRSTAIGQGALFSQNFTTATNSYNTAVGYAAGVNVTTGQYNTLLGAVAGDALTDADGNVAVGTWALSADTLGSRSTAIGFYALEAQNFTTATNTYNTAIGYEAGKGLTTGVKNIMVGPMAMDAAVTGSENIAIGYEAATDLTSGTGNIIIGQEAGNNITTSADNVVIGKAAMQAVAGGNNIAIGAQALRVNTSGGNLAIGHSALKANTSGLYNVAIGHETMLTNVDGDGNTAIGYETLKTMEPGNGLSYNTAVGYTAGKAITTGTDNTLIGGETGDALTTGSLNTAIGKKALGSDTQGSRSIAVGRYALGTQNFTTATDSYNVAMGYSAGGAITTGRFNILYGGEAGDALNTGNSNVAIGHAALSSDAKGDNSVAIGDQALKNQNFTTSTDSKNVAVGSTAGTAVTTGTDNVFVGFGSGDANTTGNTNTVVGSEAFSANVAGDRNTAIGHRALYVMNPSGNVDLYQTAVGYLAGSTVTTGDKGVYIGAGAGGNEGGSIGAADADNNVIIGYYAHPSANTGSSQIVLGKATLGHANSTFTFGKDAGSDRVHNTFTSNATFTRVSDERYKKDIQTNTDCGLDFINELRTVTFKFKAKSEIPDTLPDYDAEKTTAEHTDKLYGLIAQEVKAALAKHNITDFGGHSEEENSGIQGVAQSMFIYPLIKAVQELSAENKALADRLAALEG